MTELHEGTLRNLARKVSDADAAMDAHRAQLAYLGAARRKAIRDMVSVARGAKVPSPQTYVAGLLGISQQNVSKAVRGE